MNFKFYETSPLRPEHSETVLAAQGVKKLIPTRSKPCRPYKHPHWGRAGSHITL